METMKYITQDKVSLLDIATCFTNAGYKTDFHDYMGEALVVFYMEDDAYCRWFEDSFEYHEEEQVNKWLQKDSSLKYLLSIQYVYNNMSSLAELLRNVLECYEGFIYLEGGFFDVANINAISDVRLDD